ncbi:MAG: lipoate--protein ligase family protein [Burkholderiales bacterium]|nr:lipoate--protein ligase family protein [Burkholderiales bacterium]
MATAFGVIDTGLREGRANIAFDAALIEARRTGVIGDTIRFLSFAPSALVGRHQAIGREIKLDYCRAHGIGLARRITGGGAIYFDPGQLGWELVFERKSLGLDSLAETTAAICSAAAKGLQRLGVAAAFRPRNDIEVEGRKLCGSGGFVDADVVFFQGTLLIECDLAAVVRALNVPQPKLAKRGLETAAQRMVTLHELLGVRLPSPDRIKAALLAGFSEGLDLDAQWRRVSETEEAIAQRLLEEEIGTDAFVFDIDDPAADGAAAAGTRTTPGGTITAYLKLETAGTPRVGEALVTGDFFAAPPRLVLDLEAALRGAPVQDIGAAVERFFAGRHVEVLSVTPADFRAALEQAADAAGQR